MVVPDADFVWPGNPEGIQQNLIDSGLEVFWLRLFAGVPAAVGSRRPSLHLLVSGGTRTGSSEGRLPGKRAQLGCYFKRAVPINFSSWDGQRPGQSCPTPQL